MSEYPIVANIGSIQIRAFDTQASVIIGQARLIRMTVTQKKNQGFGQQNADGCLFAGAIGRTDDADVIDFPRSKTST